MMRASTKGRSSSLIISVIRGSFLIEMVAGMRALEEENILQELLDKMVCGYGWQGGEQRVVWHCEAQIRDGRRWLGITDAHCSFEASNQPCKHGRRNDSRICYSFDDNAVRVIQRMCLCDV